MSFRINTVVYCYLALAFVSCGRDERPPATLRLAVVMDAGGVGDKGKNDMIWRGCQRLTEDDPCLVADIECRQPASAAEARRNLAEVCAAGARTVVVATPWLETDVMKLTRRYPRVDFIIVGGGKGAENVKALSFAAYEAGYLMGVAAAAAVPAGGYGFIGGRDEPALRELANGYADGARSENPGAAVLFDYMGKDFAAPLDRGRARRAAAGMFAEGASVIFAAAGPANAEIAAVAKEYNKLVIGYESNQNYLERGYVITSLNIRWDEAVYQELRAALTGKFRGGARRIDISSDLISYPIDVNNRALIPADAVLKIEAARQRLAAAARGLGGGAVFSRR